MARKNEVPDEKVRPAQGSGSPRKNELPEEKVRTVAAPRGGRVMARVKESYIYRSLRAFGGLEYVKGEARPIPGYVSAKDVADHPYLDIVEAE